MQPNHSNLTTINTEDLIGKTFFSDPNEDYTCRRIKVVEELVKYVETNNNNPDMIRFRATTDDDLIENIITYSQLMESLEKEDGVDDEWHFKSILDHHGPLKKDNPEYNGSSNNILIAWENGE